MKNMAYALLGLICFGQVSSVIAQRDARLAPTKMSLQEVAILQLAPLDNEALLDAELAARKPGRAPHFAQSRAVDVSPDTHGSWALTEDGQQVWRLRISSPGAKSLNLGFDAFKLPPAAQLLLYTPDYQTIMGPFTPADQEEHGELWTPIIPGDELVIELQLPPASRNSYQLHLKSVNHDFVGFGDIAALSGSCNVDVVCGAADGFPLIDRYRDVIQSVGVYSTGGETFCTGFLVSNARQDCTPFFMTANHCGLRVNNAPSLVVYWNYNNSTCRPPNSASSGAAGDGSLADFNTGAIFRAAYEPSDMTLVELDDPVSPTADAWFAGWDARDLITTDTVLCVHHPNTEEKRISFEFDGTSRANGFGNDDPLGNFLRVSDWDIGTTEGGSSGSPLFNKEGWVIGKLTGGRAACGNDEYDVFGWLHISWTGGGSSSSSLRDWLDPDNTGVLVQDGYAQGQCDFTLTANPVQQSLCAPDVAVFQVTASTAFSGMVNLSVSGLAPGLQAAFVNPIIMPGGTTALQISGTQNVASGTYTFAVTASDGDNSASTEMSLSIDTEAATAPALSAPVEGAILTDLAPELVWTTVAEVFAYDVQLAINPEFTNLVLDVNSEANVFQCPTLSGGDTYYWRVRARNACGTSEWSASRSFTLESEVCGGILAGDTPVDIGSGGPNTIESSINVNTQGVITSIRLRDLDITHTYIGDLSGTLRSPSGTTIQLFNRVQNGSCGRNNMLVTLDDAASQTAADMQNTCTGNPAVSGTFQPVDPFSTFLEEEASGEWTLTIRDNASDDGGILNGWVLDLCVNTEGLPDLSITPQTNPITQCLLDNLDLVLLLGEDFGDNPSVSVSSPRGNFDHFSSTFASDTRTLTLSWANFADNPADIYPLNITVSGQGNTNSTTVDLILQTAPDAATLQLPEQDESVASTNVLFSWTAGGSMPVTAYVLQLASDESFANIMQSVETSTTQANVDLSLATGV
ncbi:MAG: hypothetical protein D6772_13960, partial [Bacteroidetes bacterium]